VGSGPQQKKQRVNTEPLQQKQHKSSPGKTVAPISSNANASAQPAGKANEKDLPFQTSRDFFRWLIHPISINTFFKEYFEKKPLVIQRNLNSTESTVDDEQCGLVADRSTEGHNHNDGWFGKKEMLAIVEGGAVEYGLDIDITSYSASGNKRRNVHPLNGRATVEQVEKFTSEGCSVRFLCPQKFSRKLWHTINMLEDFMGFQSGANTYWTPAGTQGFAPHFDDVDIFVLQTEGAKRWRLYPPRDSSEVLPRFSSKNFEQKELGEPFADIVLRKGDFLYAPRGTTHQCTAMAEESSLHITLSSCQRVTWADYLHLMLSRAVDVLFEENMEFRQTLPRNFHQFLGVMHADSDDERRDEFQLKFLSLMSALVESKSLPFDDAADQLALQFMHGRVPPCRPATKKLPATLLHVGSRVRLVQAGAARMVHEQDHSPEDDTKSSSGPTIALYHTLGNSRLMMGAELSELRFPLTYAPALEMLVRSFPKFVVVGTLPFPTTLGDYDEDENDDEPDSDGYERQKVRQLSVVGQLLEAGILEQSNHLSNDDSEGAKSQDEREDNIEEDSESEPVGFAPFDQGSEDNDSELQPESDIN
jgi:lysine-specific demethylase/histidyl-hydroxylase NO66